MLALLLPVAGAVASAAASVTVDRPGWQPWTWLIVGLLIVTLFVLTVRSEARGATGVPVDLADEAEHLARSVHSQWRVEISYRRINHPFPLPLRWRMTAQGSAGHRGAPDAGEMHDIGRMYRAIDSGRLAVLGAAGSGKSVLAIELVVELLKSRQADDPVPVLLSMASWDPERTPLTDWVAASLARDYPSLSRTTPVGPSVAAALVAAGRVLPVLDGFDEIAPVQRHAALRGIAATQLPWVLTSRTNEYTEAAARFAGPSSASVIELLPLESVDVADYLRAASRPDVATARWGEVFVELLEHPHGPLAAALRSPLMVSLARTIYASRDATPSELLDAARFPDRAAIERHLLDALVPAVYRMPETAYDPASDTARLRRWLAFLARLSERTPAGGLAWWQLDRAVPRAVFVLVGLGVGLLAAVAGGVVFGRVYGTAGGLAFGLTSGVVIGVALSLPARDAAPPRPVEVRLRGSLRRLGTWTGVGLGIGLATGLAVGVVSRSGSGLLNGLVAGTAFGLIGGLRGMIAAPAGDSAGGPQSVLREDRQVGLVQAVMIGLASAVLMALIGGDLAVVLPGGAVFVLAAALAGTSWTASYRYAVATAWLALRNRLPWQLMTFLEDARRRGVLRRTGAVYQFRSVQLQDRLAGPSDPEPFARSSEDSRSVEAISALRDWLVATAFERADVKAFADAARIDVLRDEISAAIQSGIPTIARATAAARDRFIKAKDRYVQRVGVPAIAKPAGGYAAGAVSLLEFAAIGALAQRTALDGWLLLTVAGALVPFAVLLMLLPWAAMRGARAGQSLAARAAVASGIDENGADAEAVDADGARGAGTDADDDRFESERKPTVWDTVRWWPTYVLVALSRLPHRVLASLRLLGWGCTAAGLAGALIGCLLLWDERYRTRWGDTPIVVAAVGGGLGLLSWLWARPRRARFDALQSEDVGRWPDDGEAPWASSARQDAVRAHDEWRQALLESGVLPLVNAKIAVLSQPSFDLNLPDASVSKLGDITESAQFVPTATNARLNRMLGAMSSGAIALSGPRGIGKSTLLRIFGDRRFGSGNGDLTLVVAAPTSYNSRDFLVHLFIRMCELVLPGEGSSASGLRRFIRQRPLMRSWRPAVTAAGLLLIAATVAWPSLVRLAGWVRHHGAPVTLVAGAVMVAVPAASLLLSAAGRKQGRRRDTSAEDMARYYLSRLRYLETRTRSRTGTVKIPAGLDVGGTASLQRTEQARTYPELVNDFKEFLANLALRLRSGADRQDARVVVCVDELDKIANAEEAERFINDLKTVFGIEGCFFLVAVSEDALVSFARRALAVRTTFDSAFDNIIQVQRFRLADTRRLLVQRVLRLPEPFVWLCHCLSGGLPRDLNRIVRQLYDARSASGAMHLAALAADVIWQDLDAVTGGQIARVSGRLDASSGAALRWLAAVRQLPLRSAELSRHCLDAPQLPPPDSSAPDPAADELNLIVAQFRTYLYYAATLIWSFSEEYDAVIEQVVSVSDPDDTANPLQHLADARTGLSTDPVLAWASVDAFRTAVTGIPPLLFGAADKAGET
ncbi:NACHT domain-containing protein [Actinoplanes sp. NPDC051343]|uniref:NACHT domain-containing protein n=1 Tax=Actinoplanes sp. NPDC051343 TaxID=3363906 RepID=UPI003799E8A5